MYEYMKLLQPVLEQIGIILSCRCEIKDRKYYDRDEVKFEGVTASGRPFELTMEVKDGDS